MYLFNRKNKILSIICECGCQKQIILTTLENDVYIHFLSNDYYTKQTTIYDKLREKTEILLGKKILKEMILKTDDLKILLEYLKSVKTNDEIEEIIYDNNSKIVFKYNKNMGYSVFLISQLSKKEIFLNKEHRAFEIILNKKERELIILKLEKIISISDSNLKKERTYYKLK